MAQAGIVNREEQKARLEAARARRERIARMNRIAFRATTALVVVCLFVYTSRMAAIAAGAKEISSIRQELTALREEQQYLEVKLAARQDLDRVRDEAVGRLGMRYPAEGEVIVVSLSGFNGSTNTQTAHDNTMP